MKKEYLTPMLSIDQVESVAPIMAASENIYDWGESKKGFFDEDEEDEDFQNKTLWDD